MVMSRARWGAGDPKDLPGTRLERSAELAKLFCVRRLVEASVPLARVNLAKIEQDHVPFPRFGRPGGKPVRGAARAVVGGHRVLWRVKAVKLVGESVE